MPLGAVWQHRAMASGRGSSVRASTTAESSRAELFVLAVSALSIINIVLITLPLSREVTNVVVTVDVFLCGVLLADFAVRFRKGGRHYFLREFGWLDLIGSLTLPGLRLLRLVRMVKVARALKVKGPRQLGREVRANLAEGALFLIGFLVIVVLEFGAIGVVVAERDAPNANILTGGEALWWGVVSITTTGYGDFYPVTRWGRLIGVVVLVTGVALVGIIVGYLANSFVTPQRPAPAVEPDARAAAVVEVRRLLDEQEATLAALRRRIAELEPGG